MLKNFFLFIIFILSLIFILRDELFKESKVNDSKDEIKTEKVKTYTTKDLAKIEAKNIEKLAKNGFPKEYYKMKPSLAKQQYFFNFLYPHIVTANKNVLKERAFVKKVMQMVKMEENSTDFKYLKKIAKKYRVENPKDFKALLRRIDIIPPSMALAQAAVESGWGMSRFVKLGNNLFGHWTYGKVGIVPLNREEGATHLVRIFNSFEDSIAAYILNLNRTNAYKEFRYLRAILREEEMNPSGLILSQTMINYSQIKERYLKILTKMITNNNLSTYDDEFYNNLEKENYEI